MVGREARKRRDRKTKVRASRRRTFSEVGPAPDAIFRTIVKGTAGLASATPVEAEMYASSVCYSLGPRTGLDDANIREAFSTEVVAHLVRRRSSDAVAALLGLTTMAPDPLGQRAAEAARQLLRQGVPAPAWADRIGRTRFTEAWVATDEYGDQDFLVIGFDDVMEGVHSLAVLIDHNIGGIAKDLMVSGEGVERVLKSWRDVPGNDLVPREIPAEEASARLRAALGAYDETFDPPSTDAVAFYRQFALARLTHLPSALRQPDPEPMSERERSALVKRFLASSHAPGGELVPHLARSLVDFKADYADGDPLRWSPIVVEICLLDWFPGKVMLGQEEVVVLPDVVRGWCRFVGERRSLSAASLQETLAAVDSLASEFAKAMADGSHAGPGKALFAAMVGDGVDVNDHEAIDTWVTGFNARAPSERDAVLGSVRLPAVPAGAQLDRRELAVPRIGGRFDGIELEVLDAADADDRSILLRAAHADNTSGLHGGDANMELHLLIHEVIANQLTADDPPEVWAAAQRLMGDGLDPHAVLHMLGFALSGELQTALSKQHPYDADSYRHALDALPGSWFAASIQPDH